jgi:hypothetical protein
MENLVDYISGKELPNMGAEKNRQKTEKILVEEKGYAKEDILVDEEFELEIENSPYKTSLDLVVRIDGKMVIAIKTVAGSISSWEREIVAGARILNKEYQIPFSIVTDGNSADILDTITGKKIDSGVDKIPSKSEVVEYLKNNDLKEYPKERLERQKMVFRTYDTLNVNR